MGLGGGELAILLVALFLSIVLICGFVLVGIWLIKRSARPPSRSGTEQFSRRVCPNCGAVLDANVQQGACPKC